MRIQSLTLTVTPAHTLSRDSLFEIPENRRFRRSHQVGKATPINAPIQTYMRVRYCSVLYRTDMAAEQKNDRQMTPPTFVFDW